MAYVSKELKAELVPGIKAVLKKYGLKGSISIVHYSTLKLKIKSGKIDFNALRTEDWTRNEPIESCTTFRGGNLFTGIAKEALDELYKAMNVGNHDNSDIMTDYFDVGWYTDIRLGMDYSRPYILEA